MPVNPLASDLSKSVHRRLSMFAAFAALVAVAWPSATEAQSSFVRVHQTGYVASAPKRAYLMSSASSTGSSFSVLNSTGSDAADTLNLYDLSGLETVRFTKTMCNRFLPLNQPLI